MEKIVKRSRCPQCGSLNVLKWGTQQSKQRFKCRECGRVFTPLRGYVSLSNRFPLFRKWVQGKRSLGELSKECGHSERQLRRWFDEFLDKPPKWTIRRDRGISVLIDDTWVGGRCLIVYRDQTNKSTLHYRFSDREDRLEISNDLDTFKRIGLRIDSFTTDGSEEIIQAIRMSYPHVTRQRCLVHIERECANWLTKSPRTSAGITLLRLVRQIPHIRTNNDSLYWMKQLALWHEEYGDFMNERSVDPETGKLTYTHVRMRQAYVMLNKAKANMFRFIDHPEVPKDTNGIEAFFSHLKDNLRIHRGLSREHRENFIKWYLFFTNERKRNG